MKKLLLIVSIVLLVASAAGLVRVYTLPLQIDTKRDVTLLSYQHQGKFTPTFNVDPSFIYGDYASLPSNPKYPAMFINSIDVNFACETSLPQSRQVEVTAALINPDTWEKDFSVLPATEKTGNFNLGFTIDTNQYLLAATNIDKDIGVISKEYQLIITTNIYDSSPGGQSAAAFSQDLTMTLGPDFVQVDQDMSRRWENTLGKYSYTVHMNPNSLYDSNDIVVTPAFVPKVMDDTNVIYSNLARTMMMAFSYKYQSNYPTSNLVEEVKLESTIENTGKWSKTSVLVPLSTQKGDFSLSIPLDLEQLRKSFTDLGKETGMYAQNYNLTLKATVHTTGQTQFGPIDENFIQSVAVDLSQGVIKWTGQTDKTQPGTIKRTDTVKIVNNYYRFPVATLRTVFIILTALFAGMLGFVLLKFYRGGAVEISAAEAEAGRMINKYKGLITNIDVLPPPGAGDLVIKVTGLDELVKAADGLIKPVLYSEKEGQYIFTVLDGTTRYQYEIPGEEDTGSAGVIDLSED